MCTSRISYHITVFANIVHTFRRPQTVFDAQGKLGALEVGHNSSGHSAYAFKWNKIHCIICEYIKMEPDLSYSFGLEAGVLEFGAPEVTWHEAIMKAGEWMSPSRPAFQDSCTLLPHMIYILDTEDIFTWMATGLTGGPNGDMIQEGGLLIQKIGGFEIGSLFFFWKAYSGAWLNFWVLRGWWENLLSHRQIAPYFLQTTWRNWEKIWWNTQKSRDGNLRKMYWTSKDILLRISQVTKRDKKKK